MQSRKKIIILFFIFFHLSIICIINLKHFLQDYNDLFNEDDEKLNITLILEKLTSSNFYDLYTTYSGTNSSYGFYAPNVGSEFTHSYTIINSELEILDAYTSPEFLQRESNFRFNLCTLPIQDMLLDSLSISNSYVKVMEHQISEHLIKKHKEAKCVIARIYLCQYPKTEEYIIGKRRVFNEVVQYNFCDFESR